MEVDLHKLMIRKNVCDGVERGGANRCCSRFGILMNLNACLCGIMLTSGAALHSSLLFEGKLSLPNN